MRQQGFWRMMRLGVDAAAVCLALSVGSQSVRADGPDVIVGDIMDNADYGTASGRHMYAIGTYSCNIGNANLAWQAGNSAHPVITQNFYRLVGGRFEQVGQSWVKHGFYALQDTLCLTCSDPTADGTALRPGCSDPYVASLNGDPTGLGPRSDVNASTGVFPFPWTGYGGPTNGSNNKLLSVTTADLDAGLAASPAALWFVSSMYVHEGDASGHNNMNNESYRRVGIGPAGGAPAYALTLLDTTQRARAGIYAWRDNGLGLGQIDPDVVVTQVDVVGDGRFFVASKATSLVGGQWHYEYAIQNYNSHRSGGSFSVPIPAGAMVTNIGFHDVAYYNNEPYDGTDWPGVNTGSAITWSTTPYETNVNTNALRWDNIYNFRFDCNIPPAGGTSTIGLFRPVTASSTATTATATAVVPSADGLQHPHNDLCSKAAPIGVGTAPFSNIGANTDGPDEPGSCNIQGYTNVGSDIWYLYTSGACAAGATTITTCGSAFDTKIAVYSGTCPTVAGSVIACNDDFACSASDTLSSSVSFTAAPYTNYLIRIGGYTGEQGTGYITVAAPFCSAVVNDDCVNALWIAAGVAVNGSTIQATNDLLETCGASDTTADVWYKYKPQSSAVVNVNTCGSAIGMDTVVTVYTGTCGSLVRVGCNDDNSDGTGNNACSAGGPTPGQGTDSGVDVAMTAGTTYYIRVSGYFGSIGQYVLRVIGGGGVVPLANDDCANRAVIGLGATVFSNVGATTDGPAHAGCNFNGSNDITGDLWWSHVGQANGALRIDTCAGAGFNTKIAVYSGNGCTNYDSRLLTCSDDGTCAATRAVAVVQTQAGLDYTIRVGGFNGATGAGTLTLTVVHSDFNGDGLITVSDIFAFLSGWFTNNPRADVNGDHVINVADIFAFLSYWFSQT